MVSSKSWITPLPNTTYEVKVLLKEHGMRILQKHRLNPSSGVLPLNFGKVSEVRKEAQSTTGGNQVAPVQANNHNNGITTKQVQAKNTIFECIQTELQKAQCIFQLIQTKPALSDDLSVLCKDSSKPSFQFVARLRDSSGEIDVVVPDSSGQALVGLSASEALSTKGKKAKKKRAELLGKTRWLGSIRTVSLHGAKFFVLESISAV